MFTDGDWASIIFSASGLVAAVGGATAAIVSARAERIIKSMHDDIKKVEHATNSMKDALITAALLQGRFEGAASEKAKSEAEHLLADKSRVVK